MAEPQRGSAGAGSGVRAGIERFVDAVGRATSWIALVIVVLMAVNVILRYLFSVGSVWSQELEWHLLVPLTLFGMSYAMRHDDHVRVDIVYGKFSDRTKRIVDLISALLTAVIAVLAIWFSLHYVQQSYVIDEGSPDPGGIPHRYLIKSLIPIGFALLLAQSVASAIGAWEKLRSR